MWLGGGIVVVDDDEWHTWTCGTLQGTDQITCVPNALAHPVTTKPGPSSFTGELSGEETQKSGLTAAMETA